MVHPAVANAVVDIKKHALQEAIESLRADDEAGIEIALHGIDWVIGWLTMKKDEVQP